MLHWWETNKTEPQPGPGRDSMEVNTWDLRVLCSLGVRCIKFLRDPMKIGASDYYFKKELSQIIILFWNLESEE